MEKRPASASVAGRGRLDPQQIIPVATVVAPHGIRGWVKLHAEFGPPELLLGFDEWWLAAKQGQGWQAVQVEKSRIANKRMLAKLPEVDDRDAAQAMKGCHVGLKRAQMPLLPDGEYYWYDLVGLQVIGADGQPMGKVLRMLSTAANDVLEISHGDDTLLVPFVDPYIISVDLVAGQLATHWRPEY